MQKEHDTRDSEGNDPKTDLPFQSYVPRKPKDLGAEVKNTACGECGAIIYCEYALRYKRARGVAPVVAPFEAEWGKTTAQCLRLCGCRALVSFAVLVVCEMDAETHPGECVIAQIHDKDECIHDGEDECSRCGIEVDADVIVSVVAREERFGRSPAQVELGVAEHDGVGRGC